MFFERRTKKPEEEGMVAKKNELQGKDVRMKRM